MCSSYLDYPKNRVTVAGIELTDSGVQKGFWPRDRQEMTDQNAADLPWIFGFSKIMGVSAFHTHWSHILYGLALQSINVISLCSWVYLKNLFVEKTIYGFAWGVLHIITTLTACVSAFATWNNHEKVESALKLLGTLDFDKTASYIWLPAFNVISLLIAVLLDVLLDVKPSFVMYLQIFVYCFPLLQILTATSQFIGSVMLCKRCLTKLQENAENPECSSVGLMKDYSTLYTASQLINDAFSIQNLFAVGSHGSAFALSSYIFTIAGLNYFPAKMARKKIWLSLVLTVFHLCYSLLIFKPCQSMENKGRKFIETLYDRVDASSSENHIFHRLILKQISFSACNFFKLNFSALGSIITTLVTYQVILLQFAQAEKDI